MRKAIVITLCLLTGCAAKQAVTPGQLRAALNDVVVAVNNLHGRACELEAKQKIERPECKPAEKK